MFSRSLFWVIRFWRSVTSMNLIIVVTILKDRRNPTILKEGEESHQMVSNNKTLWLNKNKYKMELARGIWRHSVIMKEGQMVLSWCTLRRWFWGMKRHPNCFQINLYPGCPQVSTMSPNFQEENLTFRITFSITNILETTTFWTILWNCARSKTNNL